MAGIRPTIKLSSGEELAVPLLPVRLPLFDPLGDLLERISAVATNVTLTGVEIKETPGTVMWTGPGSAYMGDLWEVEKINYEVVVYEKKTALGIANVPIVIQVNGKVYSARTDINGRLVSSFDAPKEPLRVSMERYAITAYIYSSLCPISSMQRFGISCVLRYFLPVGSPLLEIWGICYLKYEKSRSNLFLKSMPVIEGQAFRTELHPYGGGWNPCQWRLYPANGYWTGEQFYGGVNY